MFDLPLKRHSHAPIKFSQAQTHRQVNTHIQHTGAWHKQQQQQQQACDHTTMCVYMQEEGEFPNTTK